VEELSDSAVSGDDPVDIDGTDNIEGSEAQAHSDDTVGAVADSDSLGHGISSKGTDDLGTDCTQPWGGNVNGVSQSSRVYCGTP